jgi:mono/diheme cytochrome c family protein
MRSSSLIGTVALLALSPFSLIADESVAPSWTDVSAIFNNHCVNCHSAAAGASKGLRLDDYQAALAGSNRGAVLISGDVAGSELIRRLRGDSKPRMPFLSRPLPDTEIDLIERWIATGLPEFVVTD